LSSLGKGGGEGEKDFPRTRRDRRDSFLKQAENQQGGETGKVLSISWRKSRKQEAGFTLLRRRTSEGETAKARSMSPERSRENRDGVLIHLLWDEKTTAVSSKVGATGMEQLTQREKRKGSGGWSEQQAKAGETGERGKKSLRKLLCETGMSVGRDS